jgi:predicted DNA-binding helix-hairpin-helix protein
MIHMLVRSAPDAIEKLAQLGDATRYEAAGVEPHSETHRPPRTEGRTGRPDAASVLIDCVSHVATPTGRKPILKAMITTACEKNCYYCPFRAGRSNTHRITFKPDEMARAFDTLQHSKIVDGIFLSSGIIRGGVTTQDKLIDTAEILRGKYQYRGYIHLKIMPGVEYDQLRRAMQLADRVSINLEGATAERLNALAPKKDFAGELLQPLLWAHQIREREGIRASTTTQFVVGAVGDTDLELLTTSERLYRQAGIQRAYYSHFEPVYNTPFENLPAVDARREFRLYQSSFLLRDYLWEIEDLPFLDDGNLPLDVDPKRFYADVYLRETPIDIIHASRHELLRVPGIGPRGADAILRARRLGHLSDLADLRAIGIRAPDRAAPYILFGGRKPLQQLALPGMDSTTTG